MTTSKRAVRGERARNRERLLAASVLFCFAVAFVRGAELEERTRQAYEAYAEEATRVFLERISSDAFEGPANEKEHAARLRSGVIVAGPRRGDGIIGVPGGLIHHWVGTAFIPKVTLDEALRLSHTYADYPTIYESVVASQFLGQEGDTFRVLLRVEERAAVVTAVLDIWSVIRYVHINDTRAYSLSVATEIREVANAGQPGERLLPPDEGRGYLWGANVLTKYVERDGGVYLDLETIGLSRGFPPLLGWLIEPIARRLGRKSVEASLRDFREALVREVPRAGVTNCSDVTSCEGVPVGLSTGTAERSASSEWPGRAGPTR